MLLRRARLVQVAGIPAPAEPVDLRVADGVVVEVAPMLTPHSAEESLKLDGRWVMPGLWDQHVHPVMWALARRRLDLSGVTSAQDLLSRLPGLLAQRPGIGLVMGYGHRSGRWARPVSVAELDAVTGERPVALASGDGHNGWLNSAALRLIGRAHVTTALAEDDWYSAYRALEPLAAADEDADSALAQALDHAAALGVVGIVDFEFESAWRAWRDRIGRQRPPVRVRAATYAAGLEEVAREGLRTGDSLVPQEDRVTMGPFKIISDGSLNTLTAWCCEPYAPGSAHPRGRANVSLEELTSLLARSKDIGLTCAVHAIGDQAIDQALDAIEHTGQMGSIEHVQLSRREDLARMAHLGLTASVQPAHLLDDRDLTQERWGDRAHRTFAFADMVGAGVTLALGSDAPVAPLDPWLAMAAAVHRSGDERAPWHSEQALTVDQALAASTDGVGTITRGLRADLVVLEANPRECRLLPSGEQAAYLRRMGVEATFVGGVATYARECF